MHVYGRDLVYDLRVYFRCYNHCDISIDLLNLFPVLYDFKEILYKNEIVVWHSLSNHGKSNPDTYIQFESF